MLTHRLLVPGVFVLGLVLLVVGLAAIVTGIPIVRMEIGWTEVVGGAVAASVACVILALGVLAGQLDAIRQSLVYAVPDEGFRAEEPLAAGAQAPESHLAPMADEPFDESDTELRPEPELRRLAHPLAPQRWAPAAAAVRPEPPLAVAPLEEPAPHGEPPADAQPLRPTLDDGAPSLLHAEEESSHSPAVLPPDPVADPVADLPTPPSTNKTKPNFLSSFLARRGIDTAGPAVPGERAPFDAGVAGAAEEPVRTAVDLSSGWDEEPRASVADEPPESHAVLVEPEAPVAAEPPPLPEPDPLQPVVVGRYNAGSASYVMYSNGMIEVETEQGTHQFGSMQELKNFIEKRDARVS